MTATQIGILALHIEHALSLYPIAPIADMDDDELLDFEWEPETEMEPWEKELKDLVDADDNLCDYAELNDELVEYLVDYLSGN